MSTNVVLESQPMNFRLESSAFQTESRRGDRDVASAFAKDVRDVFTLPFLKVSCGGLDLGMRVLLLGTAAPNLQLRSPTFL